MPWWSWIVIWGGLVVGALGVLAFLGYRIVMKSLRTLDALGELGEKTEILSARADELTGDPIRPAVFDDRVLWLAERAEQKRRAAIRKQIRRERSVKRGKLLIRADPQPFGYPTKRT